MTQDETCPRCGGPVSLQRVTVSWSPDIAFVIGCGDIACAWGRPASSEEAGEWPRARSRAGNSRDGRKVP